MYTPKHFEEKDNKILVEFMRHYNFALMISSENNYPKGTHLPFLIEERGEDIFLVSHMAKANDQWKSFKNNTILVVFSEPHAYISTSFYGPEDNVPTWNYVSVHAYGDPVILETDAEKKRMLEKMIVTFHPPDLKKYKEMNENYLSKMLKGIVAFEIKVSDLQGKFKMSQNRNAVEKQNIITEFEKSGDGMKRDVADLIKKRIKND